jgi:HrpA-like RNA helicase
LKETNVIILKSPTGTGKTTHMPIFLSYNTEFANEFLKGHPVIMTEPRKLSNKNAVMSMKKLFSLKDEIVSVPDRWKKIPSDGCKVIVVNEHVFLTEIVSMSDDTWQWPVVILDEAHERSMHVDTIMCLLKKKIESGVQIKIIISSATLDSTKLQEYFPKSITVETTISLHNVQLIYSWQDFDYLKNIIGVTEKVVIDQINNPLSPINTKKFPFETLLVFLIDARQIQSAIYIVYRDLSKIPEVKERIKLYGLYGALSAEEQNEILTDSVQNGIKIVFCTNIAETSLNFSYVTAVIDCGRQKQCMYNVKTKMNELYDDWISKDSANQRKGRCGRECDGVCYRLYTEPDYNEMKQSSTPPMISANISWLLLYLFSVGEHVM